ncbi:outer membrane lipoprotein-sorting protein, partial [Acidobacteria bacterium AH-259-G07]|nr:outer membrane lipoprotein-sorting protein [Acidobacteria bacterium AH-259-G07]
SRGSQMAGVLGVCLGMALFTAWVSGSEQTASSHPKAREIIDRIDRLWRGESSHGVAEMSIVTRRWNRSKTLEIWSVGTDKALIAILEPKKGEGVATLRVGSDIWNYLPKIDRTIRVPTSMMMGSWMGSHFTNDDLVKESRLIEDYDVRISYDGKRDGVEVYEFTLTPFPEAPVVWGRIEEQVRKRDLMPTWARYYGEDGELKRTVVFSNYRLMGGRLVPARMRIRPEDKPGEYTEFVYRELEFDMDIPGRTFSLASLRKRR